MPTKDVRLDDLDSDVLMNETIAALKKNNLKPKLTLKEDRTLRFTVSNSVASTGLLMERPRARPLFVEISTGKSYDVNPSYQVVRKEKSRDGRSNNNLFWIVIIALFFLGAIIWFVSLTIQLILQTVPWFQAQLPWIAGGIGSLLVIFAGFKIYKRNAEKYMEINVLEIVYNHLKSLNLGKSEKKTPRKCWNCFAELQPDERFCSNCGQDQIGEKLN